MNVDYNITIYENTTDNKARFTLGTAGRNPMITIGLNPSYADNIRSDRTITKVMGYCQRATQSFDSFIMLNLYPQRAPDPSEIHATPNPKLKNNNIEVIVGILAAIESPSILAAWGETIFVRPFLIESLEEIYHATIDFKINWLKIGELTQSGHPRHPSRASYLPLTTFNINKYIQTLKSH